MNFKQLDNVSIIWKLTGTAIFCSMFVVLIAIWVSYDSSKELLIQDARKVMTVSLDRQIDRINSAIETVKNDVLYLSNSESIQAFARANINNGVDSITQLTSAELRLRIENSFKIIMQAKGYDHLRFIKLDEYGKELIRIDGPTPVDTTYRAIRGTRLQNKGQSSYVIEGRELLPKEVFISSINLNREHGQIQIPYKPTQRFVTPVYINKTKVLNKVSPRIVELMGKIRYYDEVLTMSAMAAAHTGEIKWENRYRKHDELLALTLEEVNFLLGKKKSQSLEKIDYANNKLLELEKAVFKLVASKDIANAQKILSSNPYIKFKKEYHDGLETFLANSENIRESQEAFGIIVINTDANKLLEQLEIDELFEVFLTNSTGGLIQHSDPSRSWGFEFGIDKGLSKDESKLWEKLLSGNEKLFYEKEHGEFHVMAKSYLNQKDSSQFLGVVVTTDEKDILANVGRLRSKVILITLFSILGMIILMYFLLKRVIRPISSLTYQANLLASGDEDVKIEFSGTNEIGRLGLAFANLVEKLQLRTEQAKLSSQEVYLLNESLEEKVELRTRELEYAVQQSQKNEQQIRTIIDSNPDGMISIALNGTISNLNPAAELMFGYESQDILGWSIQDLFPYQYQEKYQRVFERFISQSEEFENKNKSFEFVSIRATGEEFPIELSLTTSGDELEKFILVVIRDITKRKEIESIVAKKSTEQRVFNDLLRISLMSISLKEKLELSLEVVLDSSFFDLKNTGAIFLTDSTTKELTLTAQINLAKPLLSKCAKVKFGQCLCGRAAESKEIQFASCIDERHEIRFDGIKEHGHYNVPIMSNDELVGVLVLYLEPHHAKDDDDIKFLKSTSQILASIIKKEFADLELIESKKMADKANRSKSDFLANMSHEIRTPMNGVLGMTALALDTELTDEQHEYISLVKDSADNLLIILNEILDFSKIEAGQLNLEQLEFDLINEVEPCLAPLAIRTYEKDLNFVLSVDPLLPKTFIGDPLRLRQILTNLIGNSIKFTSKGSIYVDISSEQIEDSSELHFKISDTGIGIPKNKHHTIFESFSQVDSSTTRKYGGTGLGVTICKQLLELMGGKIWIESPINDSDVGGPGTTIHFTIPFGKANPNDQDSNLLDGVYLPKKILLFDTNEFSRHTYKRLFESYDCKITTVTDFCMEEKIADLFIQGELGLYDVILINLSAIDTHCIDTFNVIQKFTEQTNASVVLLYPPNLKESIRLSGLDEINILRLHKPFRQSVLVDIVCKNLHQNKNEVQKLNSQKTNNLDESSQSNRSKYKILVAEDNKINQILIKKLLSKQGYNFEVVDNGKQAVDKYLAGQYDLIIMDVQMPVMGGFEASQTIRNYEKNIKQHIPIIAMTANAMAGDKEKCLQNGMDAYVSKPVDAKVLYDYIEMYLSQVVKENA